MDFAYKLNPGSTLSARFFIGLTKVFFQTCWLILKLVIYNEEVTVTL